MSGKNSIQVAIKVRPLFKKEKDQPLYWRVVDDSIHLIDTQAEPYYFDHIFDQDATNQVIFDKMAKQIVHSAIEGFNGTIFAYGQTSSGKTYTMMGDEDNPGVMVLAAKEIFKEIERAADRQFLLRVGYIEIYNERIFDLLNKKNQDLKIHETSTGIVSVNCEEVIIRSQDDLLTYLDKGGKERTVGETNMNERSSRSHAIFRIIIESRKMERTEDDAVTQSVINLVDLAGSERADQTGARGTRLKEGGHINKSLLFLSNVIKRLSENEDDKYVSFRDSKLTRILQASLGGNALTAIICTIKANAVEETQSTLNFALRAKAVKNKPQVNEIISDATMMKRLEHEIKVLKTRLEEEQRKNESQIKVQQLEQRIQDEDLKIISCNSLHSVRNLQNRRRTWCPSSSNLDVSNISQQSSALPLPAAGYLLKQYSRLQTPKASYYTAYTAMKTPREALVKPKVVSGLPIPPDNIIDIDEEFAPGESINFERLSPLKSPRSQNVTTSLTPKLIGCTQSTLEKIENDFQELQSFTNWENKVDVEPEIALTLKHKVETLSERNAELEKERIKFLQLQQDIKTTTEILTETQNKVESLTQRNAELEKEIVEHLQLKNTMESESEKKCDQLQVQLSKLINSNKTANEKIAKYETELAELKKINEQLEMENREAVNLEFEFKRHKNKSKLRENELLEVLTDKEKEINKLEKSLNSLNAERLYKTKSELLQRSLSDDGEADGDGNVCVKYEDLQRLLEENKRITSEFEKLTLEYEKFKLNCIEVEKENEINKLKIVHLEELQEKEKAEREKLLLDVEQLREKLTKVQQDYELLGIENSSKLEECVELNEKLEVARKEMVAVEEKFIKLELSWKEQQQTISDIEAQYNTIQTKYDQLQALYQKLEVTRGQSVTDYQRLEKENVDLQTEIEDLKKKVHDAQQKLLDNNTKCEVAANETKTENEEYASETFKARQENEQIRKQLLEIQTKYEDLQKEYDDLSNQLMDNIQDSDYLKVENTKLKDRLKDFEEKNLEVARAEAEINELKSQLEIMLSSEKSRSHSSCHNSSMRSSDVCVEEEDFVDSPESQELLKKFYELSESLIEIELEHFKGKTTLFKSASKNSSPKNYKMYLKNISGVKKIPKEFNMAIENIPLQGSFKPHSFHIVELNEKDNFYETEIDMNGCENVTEYIEKLKQDIVQLNRINESINQDLLNNKSLLESTERVISEMKVQITQLSAELLEKSTFVEKCECKSYQQKIENLEKEKADITIVCEELQEKVNSTFNGSSIMNSTAIEQLKRKEQQIFDSSDFQTKFLDGITSCCADVKADLEYFREQCKSQEKEFREKHNQLQLENLQKLELSANEYRENMKKYNREWEEKRDEYELTIKDLQNEINAIKQTATKAADLEIRPENISYSEKSESDKEKQNLSFTSETLTDTEHPEAKEEIIKDRLEDENLSGEQQSSAAQELLASMKEENHTHQNIMLKKDIDVEQIDRVDKCRLEEEKLSLEQQLNDAEELLVTMKEENRNQYEEITLLDAKIVHLEELLSDAKCLHEVISRENSTLKTEIDNIKYDLNCIPELHDKNQELSDEMEKLQQEYSQLKAKYQEAETQIKEFRHEAKNREGQVQTLQAKFADLTTLEQEKKNLATDLENQRQQFKQVYDKLQKAQQQIQEFCTEDSRREELIKTLQTKLGQMTVQEDEKDDLKLEIMRLKETVNYLQESEAKNSKEIDDSKKNFEIMLQNVLELEKSKTELQLEKSDLEEKLQQITSEFNLLQKDKVLLESQVENPTEDRKSLHEQLSILQEEKTGLEEQLECLKDKEKTEELLEKIIIQKDALEQNLSSVTEKLETAQNQLNEKEKLMLHDKEKIIQIEHDLQLLKLSIEEREIEKRKLNQNNETLHQDLQALRQDFAKAIEEKESNLHKIKELQQENTRLENNLTKLEQEKRLILDKTIEEKESNFQKMKELQQENTQLENNLTKLEQEKRLIFDKTIEEKESNFHKIKELQQENTQLENDLTKLEQEKQEQQLILDKAKENEKNLLQDLRELKKSLSELEEQKELQLTNIEKNYQRAQQEKEDLEQQLKDLRVDLASVKANQNEKLQENTHLQTELQATKESLNKLQKEKENLQGKLTHYQKLQDKLKLETTLNVLKKAQSGALSSLQEEKDQLNITLQKYESENKEFKEKEKTLEHKIESLCQQIHDMRVKAHSYERLLLEHEQLEGILASKTDANEKLQQEIAQRNSQKKVHIMQIENLTCEVEKLKTQLEKLAEEKQIVQTKLSELKETVQEKESSLQKEHHELKSSFEELKLKCDSLQLSNNQLKNTNQQLERQLNSLKEKLKEFDRMQEELKIVKVQQSALQENLKKTIEEADHCSRTLCEDVERHKQMLQKQLDAHNSIKAEMETKQHSLSKENLKLSSFIEELKKEQLSLEAKLTQMTVEQEFQRTAANLSMDSNSRRRSFERLSLDKLPNTSLEEKLSAKSKTAERKNRRLSTHDERRRQSYWGAAYDKATMTDPLDSSCNCEALDNKLKECERNVFIKNSQVTALNMELKNHPLKEENATLKKRLQEEQEKHRNEMKRCKAKAEKAVAAAAHATALSVHETANAALLAEQQQLTPVLPKIVANAGVQTDDVDLAACYQKLESKYYDLKNICNYRYSVIKELEEKVAQKENSDGNSVAVFDAAEFKLLNKQYESLKKEMSTVKDKYEYAKKVLTSRREEIKTLRAQLEQTE